MDKLRNKEHLKNSLFFYFSIVPIIFLFSLLGVELLDSLTPLIRGFLIEFFITLAFTCFYYGFFSIYSIFQYTSLFFIYNCFLFTLFDKNQGNYNFLVQSFPFYYSFPDEIGKKFLIATFIETYFLHLSYCLCNRKRFVNNRIDYEIKNWIKFGAIIMGIFFIPVMIKALIQLRFIRTHGYTSIFTDAFSQIKYPFFCSGAFIFFTAGYCIFLAGNPSKRGYLIATVCFFIVSFTSALKGQRGQIVSLIVVSFYWFVNKYNVKVRLKNLFGVGFAAVLLTVVLGTVRLSYGDNQETGKKMPISKLIELTIYGQTTTRAVPMLIIQGDLKYHNYPFVFSPLLTPIYSFIYPSGQSIESAEKTNNISQVTMYNVSPEAHLNGSGYGGAFLAEAYDLGGYVGVIFFSLILGICFIFFDYSKLQFNNWLVPFLFFILMSIPTLPRGRVFGFMVSDFNRILFTYFILLVLSIINYLFKYNLENENE